MPRYAKVRRTGIFTEWWQIAWILPIQNSRKTDLRDVYSSRIFI